LEYITLCASHTTAG